MKNLFILILTLTLTIFLAACDDGNTVDITEIKKYPEDNYGELKPLESEWHEVYSDYILNEYIIFMGYITLALTDINESGTPELIIIDDSKGTLGGRFTIVTIKDGAAKELFSSGLSSFYIIYKGEIFFFRDFNSLNGGGGTFGYGYVSVISNADGPLTGSDIGYYNPDPLRVLQCTDLLKAGILDYNVQSEESELFWSVGGEENILKCPEFEKYLYIQKSSTDGEWEDISADEYLSLKNSYLTITENGKSVWNLLEISHDCFDENDIKNYRAPDKNEIDDFFKQWKKN